MKLTSEMRLLLTFSIVLTLICSHSKAASAVTRNEKKAGSCVTSIHVDERPLVVNLAEYAGCSIQLITADNKVLAFQHTEGPLSQLSDRVKIRDGVNSEAGYVPLEKHKEIDNLTNKLDRLKRETVYSSGAFATLEISEELSTSDEAVAHMTIRLAVECPFNIGTETQCGRVFDEVSCYCAIFTLRSWYDQRNFCETSGYKLVALESKEEEDSIYVAWGKDTYYWTSLNELTVRGRWVWDSTGNRLYPGYANWDIGQPDGAYSGGEHCMYLNHRGTQWNNGGCSGQLAAICEKHP